ncbi:unnamed protein product [Urochloa decumbens]|uniref:Uncharacterized protein n=1 Tax=Urochloa decumbens TaxID=240449 RepID=A0ABC8WAG6_9POAL
MQGSTSNGTTGRRRHVRVVSRLVVRPDPPAPETIHLTPWDLRMLSLDYIQKGVLIPKPGGGELHRQPAVVIVEHLASALARALGRFHPFAGRLVVDERAAGDDKSITVSLRCTGEVAEFVHAAAPGVTAANIAGSMHYIPRDLVASLFALNGLARADAASESENGGGSRRCSPRSVPGPAPVAAAADGVCAAHRVGCRGRVKSLPLAGYVGNAVVPCRATATAGEVVGNGLGWAARLLNRAVAAASGEAALVGESVTRWVREPRLAYNADLLGGVAVVGTGSSPRFDVYGNDFGWGKPVAVRSGAGNKLDGKTSVFEGRGGGGALGLEVCLAPETLARLVADGEFMDAVTEP